MGLEDTIVVEFNSSSGSDIDFIATARLSELLNVDSNGDAITQFGPGDPIYIELHMSNNIQFDEVRVTNGSIISQGSATRQLEEEWFFTSLDKSDYSEFTTSVVPSNISLQYYGKTGSPTVTNEDIGVRTYTAKDLDNIPYICDALISYGVRVFKFVAPGVFIADEDDYPVGIVFYVKER